MPFFFEQRINGAITAKRDFDQTVFTAHQKFVPTEPGVYKVKVVGYNKLGRSASSETLVFEVK